LPESNLSLALLVFRVLADHTNHPAAVDDLALATNLLYRCTDLHLLLPFSAHSFLARLSKNLFVAVNDPPAIQVVWTQFDGHAVTWKNADEVLAHSARNMGQNLMVRLELHLKHGIGQRLNDRRHYLNRVFFRQSVSRFWCFRTSALD
jgi:hypothetical protein